MNYNETIEYLYACLPMFQRIGAAAYKADIHNTVELMKRLGNPERRFKSVHVAGTNGKGSSAHLIASILREKGLKVGLHTSPHLKDFRERIKVDDIMCSEQFVIEFVEKYRSDIEEIKPSFFEMAVAMAFLYFAEEKVDVAVVEVGMGGRLDSTNVINPLVSLITNIGFDHVQFLGDTLEKIAGEKAGIIKPGKPVVVSQSQAQTRGVFERKAKEMCSDIVFADDYLSVVKAEHSDTGFRLDVSQNGKIRFANFLSRLAGDYQKKNILGVIAVMDTLNRCYAMDISDECIFRGIENIDRNFPILGRWYKLADNPLTICDTGHNEDGLNYVVKQIERTPHKKLRFVLAMVSDKDVDKVLGMLDKNAEYYLSKADIPRGLDVSVLAEKAGNAGLSFRTFATVRQALVQAQKDADEGDLVFVGGSTYTVAEVI